MLAVAVDGSPSNDNAIRYILLVLWMTPYFHITGPIEQNQRWHMFFWVGQVAAPGAKLAVSDCFDDEWRLHIQHQAAAGRLTKPTGSRLLLFTSTITVYCFPHKVEGWVELGSAVPVRVQGSCLDCSCIRCWDFHTSDILLQQKHSSSSSVYFIAHIFSFSVILVSINTFTFSFSYHTWTSYS